MSDAPDPQDDVKFKAYLAQALQNLPRDAEGQDLRRAVSAYVEGRASLSEVASTPSVATLIERGLAAFDTAWSEMSPADRGEAIEAGADVVRSIELPR
ncbi:MAG: hypothetical protein ACI379_06715 [Nocardioides sp.]|uniref:hypothetical protein n=1 Tax=Nocardioides sp. TaxID=35761 RepID=UPI003F0B9D34